MAERLFGIETEYAFGTAGAQHQRALAALMRRAKRELPYLPDELADGLFLANGARFYVDRGGHPELTTPECNNPWDVVRYLRAGDAILLRLADGEAFYRCNVDYSGARSSWGSHESHLHRVENDLLASQMIPFLASRLVFTGAGGFRNVSPGIEFTLSPRVAHIEVAISPNSTGNRGIYHDKHEPLCGNGWDRLHILCGESLCSELATWLRVGTTALVVALCEAGRRPGAAVELRHPVAAMHAFASDPTCRAVAETHDGREVTAIDVQRAYLDAVEAHAGASFMPSWAGDVCRRWRIVLDDLAHDRLAASTSLDWAIKLHVYDEHIRRRGFTWETIRAWTMIARRLSDAMAFVRQDDWTLAPEVVLAGDGPIADVVQKLTTRLDGMGLAWDGWGSFVTLRNELFEIDTRFGQLGAQGLFAMLDATGALTHRVEGVGDVEHAMESPPPVARALVRGKLVRELSPVAKGRYYCDWDGVWDCTDGKCVDLSDPFSATPDWKEWREDGALFPPDRFLLGLEARPGRRRHRRPDVPPAPDPVAMSRTALEHRKCGELERAEALLREAIVVEDAQVPPESPKRAHRRNNLAIVLMRAAKIDEALALNADAWTLQAGRHDLTSGRILFVRAVLRLLQGCADADLHLGQMKTLLDQETLDPFGDIATTWDIPDVLVMLGDVLPQAEAAMMVDLANTLNDRTLLAGLDRHPAWCRATPMPLETAWLAPR